MRPQRKIAEPLEIQNVCSILLRIHYHFQNILPPLTLLFSHRSKPQQWPKTSLPPRLSRRRHPARSLALPSPTSLPANTPSTYTSEYVQTLFENKIGKRRIAPLFQYGQLRKNHSPIHIHTYNYQFYEVHPKGSSLSI